MVIYVKNIARDEDETDDAVKDRVRKHVKRKHPIRITSILVVHNRYCEDTVGCKVSISISMQEVLMAPVFWPEDVECREWSRWRPRDNQRGNYRQGARDRDSDR